MVDVGDSSYSLAGLPMDVRLKIESVCQQFEEALQANDPAPEISKFLKDHADLPRRHLLRELLTQQIQHLTAKGHEPRVGELLSNWPDDQTTVRQAFHGASSMPVEDTLDDRPASGDVGEKMRYFGDYELIDEIGRGGMGVVYRARQVSLNRVVALKMIRSGELASGDDVARFHAEAQAAASLDHPNIVPVYEIGEHGRQQYFAMGFVEGRGLDAVIRDETLSSRKAAEYTKIVTEAIAYAHDQQILHRDIKPSNVLVDANDQLKVTDFGLAKRIGSDSNLTATGQVLGTPSYMSPEQASGDHEKLDDRSDVYSLGAMLYRLATGRPPFQADSVAATLMQVIEKEPVAPRELNSAIDADLETITLKCLEKQPDRRYASAKDLADELGRFQRGEPIRARPVTALEHGARWCKRNPVVAGLMAAVFLVLIVGVITTSYFAISSAFYANGLEGANTRLSAKTTELESANTSLQTKTLELGEANTRLGTALEDVMVERDRVERQLKRANDARHALLWGGAQRAFQQHDLATAERLLGEVSPEYEQDWETRYLKMICDRKVKSLAGHKGTASAMCVAFSPDGRTIASASSDRTVKLWDAQNGKRKRTLKGHSHWVSGVAFSPDGRTIASGSRDKTIKLWNTRKGREKLALTGHSSDVNSVAFSPDGRTVASASSDHTVKLWDAKSGREKLTLIGHTDIVHGVAFGPGGSTIASASKNGVVKLWDAKSGKERFTLKGHTYNVFGVAFSPDGRTVASASQDNTVRLWDANSGQEKLKLKRKGINQPVRSVAFSPDGRTVVSGSQDWTTGSGTITLWDAASGHEKLTLLGKTWSVHSVAYSPNGQTIVGGSSDGAVKLWNVGSGQEKFTLKGHIRAVYSVAFSPDGKTLASGSADKSIKLWDAASGKEKLTLTGHIDLPRGWGVHSVAYSPDGRTIVSGSADRTIKLWDAASGQEKRTLSGHTDWVYSVAFSPDGRTIASGSRDNTIKLWDAESGSEKLTLEGHTYDVYGVAFSPDSQTLASASQDKTIKLWDAASGREKLTLESQGRHNPVRSVAFSPDGRTIASGSQNGTTQLWDAQSGEEKLTLKGNSLVYSVAFSPDGRTLVSASKNSTIKLWDIESGQEKLTLSGHGGDVFCVTFSPDGRNIASGGMEGEYFLGRVKVWGAYSKSENRQD